MMRVPPAAVAALLLVACGSQDRNANGSAANKADGNAVGAAGGASSAGGPAMQPGQWEMVTQVTAIEMPGAPPAAQAQLRAQQGRSQTDRQCITPEQAANPSRNLVSGAQSGSCQFGDTIWSGGVIRIRATCRQPGGSGQAEMAMEGSFTATTLDARLSVSATGPNISGGPGTQQMRATSIIRGRRVGECPARSERRTTQ
jgi:hypothetical protein